MLNLPRVTQPVFGNEGPNDEFAVFGSMKTGTPVYSKDITTLLQSPAILQGWQEAVAADKAPFLEETNGLCLTLSQQIAYILQKAIPEWDPNTTYFANTCFCQVNGTWFQSLTDNNIGNNPTEDTTGTNWKKVKFLSDDDLANKVDITDTQWASSASSPSDETEPVTVLASGGSYIAPADGWYSVQGTGTYIYNWITMYTSGGLFTEAYNDNSGQGLATNIEVAKGQKMTMTYAYATINKLTFTRKKGV